MAEGDLGCEIIQRPHEEYGRERDTEDQWSRTIGTGTTGFGGALGGRWVQALLEDFTTAGKRLDAVNARCVADTRGRRDANRALTRHLNFRLNNIFVPISSTSRHITRKFKIFEGGHSNIVRAADAGFQHAAAPDRNRVRPA